VPPETGPPRAGREIGHLEIPLADGCRLGARVWLPADAEAQPVPALLEYIPYRKDDWTAARDAQTHPYYAGHGYAAVRVDLRGSGSSRGVCLDEYLPLEQADAVEVIAWIARQPWCSGAVGMTGISWGGFNSLQVAARRPPALRAIITLCASDDRYADDVHYMGGCVVSRMLPWATTTLAYNARPPLPAVAGAGWREEWLARLEQTPPYIEPWLRHQRRDAYWRQGSVCEDYAAIACPVYAIGGWADGYTNAIPRLLAGLRAPRKGLIGPWGHGLPSQARPGPRIGFLQECLRWWDHWLKGIDTGIMDGPMLRAWMVDSHPPGADHDEWPGRWVAEPSWPPPGVTPRVFALEGQGLHRRRRPPAAGAALTIRGSMLAGRDAGVWCPFGYPGDFPPDQRAEDGLSLTFTSPPLEEPLELLGFPEVTLTLAADRPQALVAVRLCDVAPDGASTLVTRGLLNLTHRHGHEHPAPLVPGRRYIVTVRLNAIGWAVPAGHRLRVAVSPTYWPWAWPSPERVRLTLSTGGRSRLTLPVRPPRAEDARLAPFAAPDRAAPPPTVTLRRGETSLQTATDVVRGRHSWVRRIDRGRTRLVGRGIETEEVATDAYEIDEGEPLSAVARCERSISLAQGNWQTRVEASARMSSVRGAFRVTNHLRACQDGVQFFTRTWDFELPREQV
jgi:uncharacterized protein